MYYQHHYTTSLCSVDVAVSLSKMPRLSGEARNINNNFTMFKRNAVTFANKYQKVL